MARISQGVVNIANERHVTLRIETNTATEGNNRAYIVIVPKFPRANASGAFLSSAQTHIVKRGPVTPDLHVFEIICMPVNEMAKFRQCISDRHRIINANS